MTIGMTKRFIMESKNIRIATSGIYDYAYEELDSLGLTLPCGAQKKKIYKVYRPAIVMEKSKDKFKMLPLTHHHPAVPVDDVNFRDLVIGYTGDTVWVDHLDNRDEVGIRAMCVLYDSEALDAYERGEIQLSAGYHAVFDWAKGTAPDGQDYDIIMKDIISVNHVALLPLGRGGSDASIMDGAPEGNDNASKDHVKEEDKDYPEYRGKGQEAVEFLAKKKNGQVRGAFNRKEIGDIDIIWGKVFDPIKHTGYGLAHIIDKHGDDYKRIGEVIEKGEISQGEDNKILIKFDNFLVVIVKDYKKKNKNWILTGYKKTKRKDVNPAVVPTNDYTKGNSLKPSKTNITHDAEKIKSIFEIYQGDIFEIAKAL